LTEIDKRLGELTLVRKQLVDLLEIWDQRLAATPEGQPARLLETAFVPAQPSALKGIKRIRR
jgi:hypothetical protein